MREYDLTNWSCNSIILAVAKLYNRDRNIANSLLIVGQNRANVYKVFYQNET